MTEPGPFPEGFTVEAVDWLPSGARSGLVRVRGHRPPAVAAPLPELILEGGGEIRRFASLPDPSADRDPTAWRGAYVLEARPAAEADRLWLEWPGGRRLALPALSVPAHQARPGEDVAPPSGAVVDRAVLAERRARRAEASEQAQSRIAKEAMRAVEVLELRASEIEETLVATIAERDALRDRAAQAGEPDVRVEVLHEELSSLRARLERRDAQAVAPAPEPAAIPARIPAEEAERRAERLREALAATIATVAELRLRLHEVEVARRTRDLAAGADAVRLAVVERERQTAAVALDGARLQLRDARAVRDAAAVELEGVQAAQRDLRARYADQSTELNAARRRVAELEAEIAAVRAEAERAAGEAVDAARCELQAEADARFAELAAAAAELQERLDRSQAAMARAETARELAEAAAMAAASERRAAAVAHAAGQPAAVAPARLRALEQELEDARAQLLPAARAAPVQAPPPAKPPLRAAPDLLSAAAEQARAAAQRPPAPDAGEVAAAISAAAEALRSRPTVVAPREDPPADIARGRAGREYPTLRGALVKLAHDDAAAAGALIAGLLGAQHVVLEAAPDYDLTIEEVGTFAVSRAGATTLVNPLAAPRGRRHAAFHLRADALTLAEIFAGVEQRPRRRRGALRASGSVRRARRLAARLAPDVALADLVKAGAQLDPVLVVRGLAYAVAPAWTLGETWVVELHVGERPMTLAARSSGGLEVQEGTHDSEPDARVRLSEADFRRLLAGDPPGFATEGDEQAVLRLLELADRARGHSAN